MANRFLIICGGTGYKLLGQRSILGIDAELQIDVSRENISSDWKVKDQRSLYVDLDSRVGTTAVAFNSMRKKLENSNPKDNSEALRHINLLVNNIPGSRTLEWGLAQSPAVGKAAIAHEYNESSLRKSLMDMINQYGSNIGPQNPIEVWIVSSTAGGTGEGTHRFVASILTDIVCNTYTDTPLSLNFIRIGPLTYRSVNNRKTSINTFFGIAADSALMLRIKNEFPQSVTNWFYMDLPDVGKGDSAKPIRGEIVEMACKAIMLPELQDDIQKLLVNNIGAPVVLVRTGFWGRDFGNQQKYFETLKQLVLKLQDLVEPNYERVFIASKPQPEFYSQDTSDCIADAQSSKYILNRMEKMNWRFPNYKFGALPKSLELVRTLINDWKKSILELMERDIDQFKAEFKVDEDVNKGSGSKKSITLSVIDNIDQDAEWFVNISNVHRVRAWSRNILGMDYKDGIINSSGLIASLLKQADQLSKIFNQFDITSSSMKKASKTAGVLGTFIRTLVQVDNLINLELSSSKVLDTQLSDARLVLKTASEELNIIKNMMTASPTTMIYAAELSDILDLLSQKTWLKLLRDAVVKNDLDSFRKEVLKGATGLTEEGLKYVLNLQSTQDITDIQNKLATKVGQMVDGNGGEYEGVDWQSTPPPSSLEYYYRILPQVDRPLREQLRSHAEKDGIPYRYVFTKFGTIGLYVLAFHGVSLTLRDGDTTTAPAFLMHPFIEQIRGVLSDWPSQPKPNTSSGQLEISTAGAIGEPLYKRAMKEAGLTDEELQKINEFYKLVD